MDTDIRRAVRSLLRIAIACLVASCTGGGTPSTALSPTPAVTAIPTPGTPAATPAGLLPDGAWQVELTKDELIAAGARSESAIPGRYTWTFEGHRARLTVFHDGQTDGCSAEAAAVDGGVLLHYLTNLGCGGWTDTISWRVEGDRLHLKLVDSTVPREQDAPYLEAKPWQSVQAQPIPAWPDWSIRCEPGCQGPVGPGTFRSADFLPGLTIEFTDDAWFNTRDDEDEIEFDLGDTALRFWGNPRASTPTGDPDPAAGTSEAGLTTWFVNNPNMVVSKPASVTLGQGTRATTFTMGVSEGNANVDPECPTTVRSCLNVLWINEGHVFGIAYGSAERFHLLTLDNGDLIVISLDAPDAATLDRVAGQVDKLFSSLRLP